jgi:lipoate-protein ligase A
MGAVPVLRVAILPGCPPARFGRLGAGLLAVPPPGPTLVVAELAGDGLLLGRHQRAASTLDLAAVRARGLAVVRRVGGGRSVAAGDGTVGVLLATPSGERLADAPFTVDRTLNRYVRGLLSGLRDLGARSAAWFGRDFVAADSRRVAAVSQEAGPDGPLLLEAVIGVRRPVAPDDALLRHRPHADPRVAGPPAVTLAELAGRTPSFDEVAAALMRGWGELHRREPEPVEGDLPEAPVPDALEDEAGLAAGAPVEVPIGFVEALAGAAAGRLVAPRLRGDLMAPAHVLSALEGSLEGAPLDALEVGQRVDAAFRLPFAFAHGLRSLRALADAALQAGHAAAARTGAA